MDEVVEAVAQGRLIEAFGAGTACVVAPVSCINFLDKDHTIPAPKDGLAPKLFNHILSLQHGEVPSKFVYKLDDVLQGKF